MVELVRALLAASLGLMIYLAIPIMVMNSPAKYRKRVGTFYFKLAARCLKQFTFVRRILSGYDILPISVDDEQKQLKVKLSKKRLGDDNEYRFNDPDNRIQRLFNKPVAIAYEQIPAAIDAELAELGYWVREKDLNQGLWHGSFDKPSSLEVDPYVKMKDTFRLVDPIDAFELIPNGVDPENIKTTEQLTLKRYEKYGSGIGIKETLRVIMGFAVGLGGVVLMQYINSQIITGDGGDPLDNPIGGFNLGYIDPQPILDIVVMLA